MLPSPYPSRLAAFACWPRRYMGRGQYWDMCVVQLYLLLAVVLFVVCSKPMCPVRSGPWQTCSQKNTRQVVNVFCSTAWWATAHFRGRLCNLCHANRTHTSKSGSGVTYCSQFKEHSQKAAEYFASTNVASENCKTPGIRLCVLILDYSFHYKYIHMFILI